MFPSEVELKNLVDDWNACTLSATLWTHAAHVGTCSYLLWHHTLADAYRLMKEGLFRFNQATGVPNTDERGYHETLTRFWCTLLFFEIHRGHYSSCIAAANAMLQFYGNSSRADRDYYSFDVLTSKEARRQWKRPDLKSKVPLEAFDW